MQEVMMRLSESQASVILPLLNELNIDYETQGETQEWCEFKAQIKSDVAAYKRGELKTLSKDEFNAHRDEFMRELNER